MKVLNFRMLLLEKLAHDQITAFLNTNKLLDPLQTGFRKYSSTETALLRLTDGIRLGMSKKLITILLQFDFSKAFDSISPSKLMLKLKNIGFSRSELKWIQ